MLGGHVRGVKVRPRLTLLTGFVESLFFCGIAYGWASLVFVLKTEGYFSEHCFNTTGPDNIVFTDCSGQDEQFSMVFTIASFSMNILRFPLGILFDRYGTMAIRLLAISLYTSGTLLIALSSAELSVLLFPAVSCLITSGALLYTSNAQVGNLFDLHRSTVVTIYAGAFDSSAAVFLIVKVLYESGISICTSFLALSACSVVHLTRTVFLMPRGHIPYPLPAEYAYGASCGGGRRIGEEEGAGRGERYRKSSGEELTKVESFPLQLQDKLQLKVESDEVVSFRGCVLSWFFLWHLVWVIVMQFCHFLFIATVNPMLNRLANSDQTLVSQYTNAFAFTQLCGVLCAPWNGLLMDRHKGKPLAPGESKQEADLRSSSLPLLFTSLQCFLFSVCFSSPVLPLQYLTFALQVINSSFIYGGHQAFVSIAFPSIHFGKVSGLMMSISAVVLLCQFPVLYLIREQLHGDPLYVNVGVTLLSLLTFIHPIHILLYCRRLSNQRRARRDVANTGLKVISNSPLV